jgi:hypothetical protein
MTKTNSKRPILIRLKNRVTSDLHFIFRQALLFVFRFDPWHVASLQKKEYALSIIDFLNTEKDLNRKKVVEIGSGLGDIIRNLEFEYKLALDIEANALKANRFLSLFVNRGRGLFKTNTFSFPDSKLEGKFDVIILVNWIHNISPSCLQAEISDYFNFHLNPSGIIVFDIVDDPSYQFNHTVENLTSKLSGKSSRVLGPFTYGRKIIFLKKDAIT